MRTSINLSPNPYAIERATETNPYSLFNSEGEYLRDDRGNLRWATVISMLMALVSDTTQPTEARARASEVLAFYAETVAGVADYPWPVGTPQSIIDGDIEVAKMFGVMYANSLWFHPEDYFIRDWPQKDTGRVHPSRSVMNKKYHSTRLNNAG